ncbi:toxin-antitoxin system YwqK family antitoxin [Emticicia sp. SJ17W-69]|uniref:toxin-antitoxin system YwqK family antitoxin n=1 Tax=Emticicia sp. SJ17W-69 TaxID=3421657 RepID=UPI003EBFBA17
MKLHKKTYIYSLICFYTLLLVFETTAQVPQAKRKGDKDYKKETIQEKLDKLPVGVTTPKASASLPGGNNISSLDDAKKFATETLPDLGLKISKTFKDVKKELKSLKKEFNGRDYEGLKVQKQLIRQGSGNSLTFFEFYTLKEFTQPNPYNRHLFWFDHKANRIVEGTGRDRETNDLMHGPYKKYLGDLVVEEGWYYLGTKDGRWETYDKNYNLLNKEYYNRGFYEDSEISYYDEKQSKIKEVKPKLYGKVTGEYFLFNESGTLAEQGFMDDSVKVNKWIEYYPTGNRRKKEIQFGKDCYDTSFESYVLYEYDERGKITFESPKIRKN